MKTLFIVPGFTHGAGDACYKPVKKIFEDRGFRVVCVSIDWKYRVMREYVKQFEDVYKSQKSEINYVLGFSFGAMIALISAPTLQPDEIILCSLSPYFKEDLGELKPSWAKIIGKRRIEDFAGLAFGKIASKVRARAVVFIGEAEGKRFPKLTRRCEVASKLLTCDLVVVPGAPHDIAHPNYLRAIKEYASRV